LVLINHERGRIDVGDRVRGREDEPFFLSVVTASELPHGVHRAKDRGTRARRSAFVEGVLGAFPLLPIEIATTRMHARLWIDLASVGAPIGVHDLWLAAGAITHDLVIVTSNIREFERVEGLSVEEWS
jgi:predicted nucleic acid-binding protein